MLSRVATFIVGLVLPAGLVCFVALGCKPPPDNSLESMLEELEDAAPEVRARAETDVLQCGPEVLLTLVDILEGTNGVPVPVDGGSKALVQATLGRERMRRQAMRAFEVLGAKGLTVSPRLVQMMDSPDKAPYAARALVGIGAVAELSSFQKHPQAEVRVAVASALGRASSPEAVLALLDSLDDSTPAVRAASMESLGLVNHEIDRVVPALMEGLKDPEAEVRAAAAKSLGKHAEQARPAVDALQTARQDRNQLVRRAARRALELIELDAQ